MAWGVVVGVREGVGVGVRVDAGVVVVDPGARDVVDVGDVGVVDCPAFEVQAARLIIATSATNIKRYLAKCNVVRIFCFDLLTFDPFWFVIRLTFRKGLIIWYMRIVRYIISKRTYCRLFPYVVWLTPNSTPRCFWYATGNPRRMWCRCRHLAGFN